MAVSKTEALRLAERRAKVVELYVMGLRQSEIAVRLGLAGPAGEMVVSRDLAAVKKAWADSAVRDWDQDRGRTLGEIAQVKREAWAAFERSKGPEAKRDGNPRFLALVLDCISDEAELLGLKVAPGERPAPPPIVQFVVHRPDDPTGQGADMLPLPTPPGEGCSGGPFSVGSEVSTA
jgi:hypothetical protein